MEVYKWSTGKKTQKQTSIHLTVFYPNLKLSYLSNTMEIQIRSSNLHFVSKSDFEIQDWMRLQAISGGNSH